MIPCFCYVPMKGWSDLLGMKSEKRKWFMAFIPTACLAFIYWTSRHTDTCN